MGNEIYAIVLPIILSGLIGGVSFYLQQRYLHKLDKPRTEAGIVAEIGEGIHNLADTVSQLEASQRLLRTEVSILWAGAMKNAKFIQKLGHEPPFVPNGHLLKVKKDVDGVTDT